MAGGKVRTDTSCELTLERRSLLAASYIWTQVSSSFGVELLLFYCFKAFSVHTENGSFSLFLEERSLIWPKEVFLLSFNFRAVYIDLKLKEMIFRITTVSIGPIAGEEEKI